MLWLKCVYCVRDARECAVLWVLGNRPQEDGEPQAAPETGGTGWTGGQHKSCQRSQV